MSTMRKTFNALDTISIMTGHGSFKHKLMKELAEFFKPKTEAQHKAVDDLAGKIAQQDKNIQNTLSDEGLNKNIDAYQTAVKDAEPETLELLSKGNEELGFPKTPQELDQFNHKLSEFRVKAYEKDLNKELSLEKREKNDEIIKQAKGENYDTEVLDNNEANQLALEIKAEDKTKEVAEKEKDLLKDQQGTPLELANNVGGNVEKAEELAELIALVP